MQFLTEISELNLEVLSLHGCSFSGSLPYLGDLTSLKVFSLAENELNGTLISKGNLELICKNIYIEHVKIARTCKNSKLK
jgi:hypothetical protein